MQFALESQVINITTDSCTLGTPVPNVPLCICLSTLPCLIKNSIRSPFIKIMPGILLFLSGCLVWMRHLRKISLSNVFGSLASFNGATSPNLL